MAISRDLKPCCKFSSNSCPVFMSSLWLAVYLILTACGDRLAGITFRASYFVSAEIALRMGEQRMERSVGQ